MAVCSIFLFIFVMMMPFKFKVNCFIVRNHVGKIYVLNFLVTQTETGYFLNIKDGQWIESLQLCYKIELNA